MQIIFAKPNKISTLAIIRKTFYSIIIFGHQHESNCGKGTTIHTYIIFGHMHVILTDVSLLNTDNKRSSSQGDIE